MSIILNTNMASLNAQRNLSNSTVALSKTFERLSSGLRLNHAADDSAGLAISTRMSAQIRGSNQAIRNANDAISLVQVADSSLEQTTSALQRIRELTVQAASDTYTSSDRSDIQKEVSQLVSEIQRIATQTSFNGQNLLTGSYGTTHSKYMQIGAYNTQQFKVAIGKMSIGAIGISIMSTAGISGNSALKITSMISAIDAAIKSVSTVRSQLGAYQNRFEAIVSNLTTISNGISAASSRITDADIASETSNLTRNSILQQAGAAVLAQANQQPQIALTLLGK